MRRMCNAWASIVAMPRPLAAGRRAAATAAADVAVCEGRCVDNEDCGGMFMMMVVVLVLWMQGDDVCGFFIDDGVC